MSFQITQKHLVKIHLEKFNHSVTAIT